MRVCEFPRWALLGSCLAQTGLGWDAGAKRNSPSADCPQETRELEVSQSRPHYPGVDSQPSVL